MDVLKAITTLFLVMDPLGNIPLFLSALRTVAPERRRLVLAREVGIAYIVLLVFLIGGNHLLTFLGLTPESISIAGGIVLFLIALRMIFPREGTAGTDSGPTGVAAEPFVVPLAIPLVAGPSTLATVLLLQRSAGGSMGPLFLAVTAAWALTAVILLSSTFFYRLLGDRGLTAVERLMGMLLVMVAVQMFMDGVKAFLER